MRPLRLVALVALLAVAAGADEPPSGEPPSPRRPVPEYDGRPPEPTSAGDVLIWVPRVVFFPVYVVTEFVLRRPIGAFISYAELHHWPEVLFDFFTFGEEQKVGLVPTFLIEFGFVPSVGLYFFADDAFADGNALRIHAGFWGPSWLGFGVTDRYTFSSAATLAVSGSFQRRPDRLFYGIGPDSRDDLRSRFSDNRYDAGLALTLTPSRAFTVALAAGVRGASYRDDTCCNEPSVAQRIAAGELPPPPGYGDSYTVLYQRAVVTADSRTAEHRTGVRAEVRGETAFEPSGESRRWISYGGSLAASVDLTGHHRVLGLGVDLDFVDPLDDGTVVPFIEQVVFGGEGQLRGFPIGRLVDRSGASATLLYTWPVWSFLDGSLFVSVGNVFDKRLTGLEPGELRLSGGIGVRSNGSTDNLFEILFGFGTDTFDAGAAVTSIRVVIGAHHGF